MFQVLKGKLKNIIDAIELSHVDDNIGLLSGQCGIALFYFYCSSLVHKGNCVNRIEEVLIKINNGIRINTFCSGIAGFGWTLEFLKENNLFNQTELLFLDELDDFLYKKMITEIKNQHYDFLHGAIGYGMYFLKRTNKKNVVGYLSELVENLETIAIRDADGCIKWESIIDYEKGKRGYNISLSHGIASIIVILTKVFKAGIEKERCKLLLIGAVKYILQQEIDKNKYNSYFPSWSIESNENLEGSRLGWCYGDLGIAMALRQAGQVLTNLEWTEKAMEILLYSTTRKELKRNFLRDAGLCHGTAGIGHIFYRMYWNTKRPEFKAAADYWFEETYKMAYHKDGLAGFKAWHNDKHGGWVNEINLLEGISGIGLAIYSWLNQVEPVWDECLLLS